MIRVIEGAVFGGVALVVHLAAFAGFPDRGAVSEGGAGEAQVALVAGSQAMRQMVESWSRPVEVVQTVPDVAQPSFAAPAAPTVPMPRAAPPRPMAPLAQTPVVRQPDDIAPRMDTAPYVPPITKRAPVASLRPIQRRDPKAVAKPRAKPPAAKPAARAPAGAARSQSATGQGRAETVGRAKSGQSATLSKAARQSLMAKWGASIRSRVEQRKRYPSGTRAQGTAVVRISVSSNGRLVGASIARSSGNRSLDQAALRAARQARYPRAPKGLTGQHKFNLPIAFNR